MNKLILKTLLALPAPGAARRDRQGFLGYRVEHRPDRADLYRGPALAGPGRFDGAVLGRRHARVALARGGIACLCHPLFCVTTRPTTNVRSPICREAYWASEGDAHEWLLGVNTVFWGVTESVHLVDIINQTDAVGDIDGEDKLGQPMVNLALLQDWGQIDLYVLPYFRERTFAGEKGRLRPPVPVDGDAALYESADAANHVDFALRYSHFVGSIDIGLSAFKGTSREPRLLLDPDGDRLIPFYDQIEQLGLDLQYTGDAWLWKLETIDRDTQNDRFNAAVGGFEYTLYQVAESAADIGMLLELQYDGRADGEPITLADNDVFAGLRLALNDVQDTAVLAGIGYDVKTSETYLNVEADRRLGDAYVLELCARLFSNASPGDTSYTIAKDSYLQLQLSRYF